MIFKTLFRRLSPSTRAFIREARETPNYSLLDGLHGYFYARWCYFYIAVGAGQHPLYRRLKPLLIRLSALLERWSSTKNLEPDAKQKVAHSYHGKVVPLAGAKKLITIRQEVNLTNLEQVIPYRRARDIVLRNPDHIVVLDCPCRVSQPNPCTPVDVCLVVGEPFASFVIEHHPQKSRWISADEAVNILEAEHDRGHVQHAFFKDAMFGRFYAICNCCSCCCGAMNAYRYGVPMLASSGFVSQVDKTACISCGVCETMCQFEAIAMNDEGVAQIATARCMGCGVCADHCVAGAITLRRAPERGKPLEIENLMESASTVFDLCN